MSRLRILILSAAAILICAALLSANPGNLLTRRSVNFSDSAFDQLKVGDLASAAVAALGEPLEISETGPVGNCVGCKAYLFQGNPPKWVWSYEEAWILVDKEGLIAARTRTHEP